ncbi:MAG: zf-HC2 domain-containing protein [Gemmatimonadota bacterium]
MTPMGEDRHEGSSGTLGNEETVHVTTEEIAAYLERSLSNAEQATIEAHLTECALCREDVAQAWDLIHPKAPRKRWLYAIPPAAAAAVVAFLLLAGPRSAGPPEPTWETRQRTERASEREAVASIAPVTPLPEAPVDPDRIMFTWRGIGGQPSYTLTLTAENGEAMWTAGTSDTSLVLPPDIRLEPGRLYFWYVDALLADGRSATSGLQSFTTRQ